MLSFSLMLTGSARAAFKNFVRAEKDKLMDGEREDLFISFNINKLHLIEDRMPFEEAYGDRKPVRYR